MAIRCSRPMPSTGSEMIRAASGTDHTLTDHADVSAPPPLIYLTVFALGFVLQIEARLPALTPIPGLVISIVALGLGGGLALSSVQQFRRAGSTLDPSTPTRSLVTCGAYALTRNPIYLGLALTYAGTAVLTGTTWALVVLPAALLIVDRSVIAREEQYLERAFGEDYLRYKTRTRRWI